MKCLSCQSERVENFFVLKNAPVQSLITIKTYEDAIAIPKKDITLCFCSNCGFIFNSTFDTSIDYYTQGYEDQQGFSPTWLAYQTGVTNKIIDKYNLREKDIIEIGCGKGDYLQLICKLGNNRGIGIDPSYVSGRSETNPNVKFIKEFYSEKHGELPVDLIVCKHTMEHIYDTFTFVKNIRDWEKRDKDIHVFIEVPTIVRILKINAFWDIYTEHCSYFSPGSLGRLFRRFNFEILDTYLGYDDQYLYLEAKISKNSDSPILPLEESVEELKGYVDNFVVKINEELSRWNKILIELKQKDKKVVIWGGGSKSVGFLTHFNDLKVISHVVDLNPHMQGNFIPSIGMQYVGPEFLKTYKPDTVIIMNGIYKNEIGKMLSEMDLTPELICL